MSDLELDPNYDEYTVYIDRLYRRGNTYLIWLIIAGIFLAFILVLRKLFK